MSKFIKAERSIKGDLLKMTTDDEVQYGFTLSTLEMFFDEPVLQVFTDAPDPYLPAIAGDNVFDPANDDWQDVTPTPEEAAAYLNAQKEQFNHG